MKRTGPPARKTALTADPDKQLRRRPWLRSVPYLDRSGLSPAPGGREGKTPQQKRRTVQLATWADVLEQMYPRDDYRCAGCGTTEALNGHHATDHAPRYCSSGARRSPLHRPPLLSPHLQPRSRSAQSLRSTHAASPCRDASSEVRQ